MALKMSDLKLALRQWELSLLLNWVQSEPSCPGLFSAQRLYSLSVLVGLMAL